MQVGLVALQEDAPRQLRDLLDGQVGAAGQRELLGKGADLRGWWRCGGVNKGWRRCETASWSTSAMVKLSASPPSPSLPPPQYFPLPAPPLYIAPTSAMVTSSAASSTDSLEDWANANETATFSTGSLVLSTMTLLSILAMRGAGGVSAASVSAAGSEASGVSYLWGGEEGGSGVHVGVRRK